MKDRACFHVMSPTVDGHRTIATFYVHDEAELLETLRERLPALRHDQALVGMNEAALGILLQHSVRGAR